MEFALHFKCDGPAFGDDPRERRTEAARILRAMADTLSVTEWGASSTWIIRDANRAEVGFASLLD